MSTMISHSDTQQVFHSENASPLIVVNTHFCSAIISLQGGQLLSYIPRGDSDWFWLSPLNNYATDSDITGGIPICLPWFGRHAAPGKPSHGFARNNLWQLQSVNEDDDQVQLLLRFDYAGDKPQLFATPFRAEQSITLGREQLTLALNLQNRADTAVDFSWAWHSYFAIDDLSSAEVTGLDQHSFLDNTDSLQRKAQQGAITFNREVDAVFETTQQPQQLDRYEISGSNCPTCIVWNPDAAVAATKPRVQQHYTDFICVERGNAFGDTICLAAGESHQAQMTIRKHG